MLPDHIQKAADYWDDIDDHLRALYPSRYKYQMSQEMNVLWRKRLGMFPLGSVLNCIDEWASRSRYFPHLSEILELCRARLQERSPEQIQSEADLEAALAACEQEWEAVNQVLSQYTDEELEKFKAEAMEQEPFLAWMADKPIDTKWWKGVIYGRIKDQRAQAT
jgi:hypothetical protein